MKCAYCHKPITSGRSWEEDLHGNDYHFECLLEAVELRAPVIRDGVDEMVDMVLMGVEEETLTMDRHANNGGLFYVEAFSAESGWFQSSHQCCLEVATFTARELHAKYDATQFRITPLFRSIHEEVAE